MAQEAITADAAFDRLRTMSQSANVKPRGVAQQIVDSVLDGPTEG